MVRNLIEAQIREIVKKFIKKDEKFYIFANKEELFIFLKNLQNKKIQTLRVKINKIVKTILRMAFYDLDQHLVKLKSFQHQNKMYLQRLTDLKKTRKEIHEKNQNKKIINKQDLELNLKNINKHFIKYIDFLKKVEAIIINKNMLESKKYIFIIKKRSVSVFNKDKKQYFSINNVIKFEDEIERLFK